MVFSDSLRVEADTLNVEAGESKRKRGKRALMDFKFSFFPEDKHEEGVITDGGGTLVTVEQAIQGGRSEPHTAGTIPAERVEPLTDVTTK